MSVPEAARFRTVRFTAYGADPGAVLRDATAQTERLLGPRMVDLFLGDGPREQWRIDPLDVVAEREEFHAGSTYERTVVTWSADVRVVVLGPRESFDDVDD